MKVKAVATAALIFALLSVSASAFGHHGTVAYDAQHPVTLKGTVAGFEWTNPHCQIHLDVTDENGKVVHWNFEAQPPNVLIHAGWTKNSLRPGDQITVEGDQAKNGTPIGIIRKVTMANGQELTMTVK